MPAKFFTPSPSLQTQLDDSLENIWEQFPQLAQNQIALTWISYEPPYRVNTGGALSAEDFWQYQPQGASYRGVELVDPGDLVHLFYLIATHVWLEQGMTPTDAEIERAMTDMMVRSSADATSYLMDVLTGTTSGPTLPPGPLTTWEAQRNIVNRYFANLGWPELRSINLNQKTWCDGPYGRERDFLGKRYENQNKLTTEATARALHSVVGGVSVSSVRSQSMMRLMECSSGSNSQDNGQDPIVEGIYPLDSRARIWSKVAVTTAQIQHAAAYIEAEGIHPFLLVVCTESTGQPLDKALLPLVAQQLFKAAQQNFSD